MRLQPSAALTALTLWMLAGWSEAGTLEVRFALGGGQIVVSQFGLATSEPQTMFTGTARVVLTGVDPLGAITDPGATASLLDVNVQVDLSVPTLPIVLPGLPGLVPFRFTQLAPVTGAFDGAMLAIPPGGLRILRTNSIGGIGSSPNQMAVALRLALLDTSGAGQLMLNSILGDPTLNFVRFDIVGREVSRSFVPEPAEIGLLTIGLALLAAGAWIIRASQEF